MNIMKNKVIAATMTGSFCLYPIYCILFELDLFEDFLLVFTHSLLGAAIFVIAAFLLIIIYMLFESVLNSLCPNE